MRYCDGPTKLTQLQICKVDVLPSESMLYPGGIAVPKCRRPPLRFLWPDYSGVVRPHRREKVAFSNIALRLLGQVAQLCGVFCYYS